MDSSQTSIRNEISIQQRHWAISFLTVGGMTYFLSAFVDPAFGSVAVMLGILNYLINGRMIFLVNSFVLWFLAGVTLIGTIDSVRIAGSLAIITTFGVIIGLLEGVWGVGELRKFIKFRRL